MQYKLSQPIQFDGQEVTELNFDPANLNKKNYDEAVAEFKAVYPQHQGDISTSIKFTKFIIAKLINKPVFFLSSLPVPDFVALRYSYFNQIRLIRDKSVSLNLELDKLTTRDYELAEDRFMSKNPQFSGAIEVENGYVDEILCIAAKVGQDDLDSMEFGTYLQAKEQVASFLFGYFSSSTLMNLELPA